ncbi:YybS family protein [Haloplasma contractile]|uniref:Uncharacterized protein n=1 Tax=Haloplasma contractile SSD-17B TaxID=1033810 RepID=U2EC08_9MOLU|nr:hypothetical protein [Haloplasma contractile]ERJ12331.1 hypothetical protein HLPCO_001317 [Haloplasma contractile SSD-17B]
MKIKNITEGAMLSSIAAIFQLIPIFISEIFIMLTTLSTVPIYLNARRGFKIGLISYIVTAFIVFIFSIHESIMFMLTNGLIGLMLGVTEQKFDRKIIIVTLTSFVLTGTLLVANYLLGIPVIGINLSSILLQVIIITAFSITYITVLYHVLIFIKNRLTKIIK